MLEIGINSFVTLEEAEDIVEMKYLGFVRVQTLGGLFRQRQRDYM